MLNLWCGQGRLVHDIDLRYTAGEVPVVTFTIACDRDYRPKGEEREADFIDCVAWRSNAEFVSKWFHKGDMIIVNGRLQTRTYEDKNGVKRKVSEVIVDNLNFGGGNRRAEGTSSDEEPKDRGQEFMDIPEGTGDDPFSVFEGM